MTSKVWEVMNDLEMVTSKIVSAREIIDTAAEAIQEHDYDKAETLAMAAYEFLGYYLEEFDEKFKLAWQETVKKQPQYQYTATGEKWTDFWEDHEESNGYGRYSTNTKWVLPVEQVHDEYFVSFPDDLLKAAKLKEGDTVEWIDNGDGSFKIAKVTKSLEPDEC